MRAQLKAQLFHQGALLIPDHNSLRSAKRHLAGSSPLTVFSPKSNLRIVPEIIDLSLPNASEKIVSREDPAKWRFADLNELWSGMSKAPW